MAPLQLDQGRLQQFSSLELIARQVVEGFITGLHKSPFHGFSVEFAEHRLYNPGESTRHIDWKLYGRTERMYVKRYEEETNLRCQVVLDVSSSMYYPLSAEPSLENPNKMVFSVFAAAAIMNLLRRQRDAFGLTLFSDKVELATQTKSSSLHLRYLYHELEKYLLARPVSDQRSTAASATLHTIADQIHKRSLVVIFSDMMDSLADPETLFSALQHLRHNKHEVILFHVADHEKEFEFHFDNRPHRFIDLETGRELKVQPAEVREKYLERIRWFNNELKLRCGQYRIDMVEADINKGFRQVLLPYLMKREKLY
ncbi:MAG: DUF58 domain-containing protein [Bacteroidales bacterium]|nr:DUF58 domain-containing protein [Bacteroidales bacterium]